MVNPLVLKEGLYQSCCPGPLGDLCNETGWIYVMFG